MPARPGAVASSCSAEACQHLLASARTRPASARTAPNGPRTSRCARNQVAPGSRSPHGAGKPPILLARASQWVGGLDHQTACRAGQAVVGFIKDGSRGEAVPAGASSQAGVGPGRTAAHSAARAGGSLSGQCMAYCAGDACGGQRQSLAPARVLARLRAWRGRGMPRPGSAVTFPERSVRRVGSFRSVRGGRAIDILYGHEGVVPAGGAGCGGRVRRAHARVVGQGGPDGDLVLVVAVEGLDLEGVEQGGLDPAGGVGEGAAGVGQQVEQAGVVAGRGGVLEGFELGFDGGALGIQVGEVAADAGAVCLDSGVGWVGRGL